MWKAWGLVKTFGNQTEVGAAPQVYDPWSHTAGQCTNCRQVVDLKVISAVLCEFHRVLKTRNEPGSSRGAWEALGCSRMKPFPGSGCREVIGVHDARKLRAASQKCVAPDAAADPLGEEWGRGTWWE